MCIYTSVTLQMINSYHESRFFAQQSIMADDAIEYMLADVSINGAERVVQ